ncbi:hypothetical protein DXT99_14715 [Pontibacter diazotrophicus]|uniref:STAS/SEC14 domain-containing protein n=1 Tax=Pontibacter diazotrophicus TaxID=1400979 RepID=A0A3D8LAM0_9BACT|nr:hypothetical protein [Pontibacter diazotrophicus]RDV14374.1 hypothetical protein DXT99_14715 [Pontibacter diazotrophicus]
MYSTDQNTASNEYKIVVAQNQCYELLYDSVKNRIYFIVKGFWKNKEAVPHYLKDIEKALKLAKPGFSLLSDLRTMITHPQRLCSMHIEAQTLLRKAGLNRVASVEPLDRIATLQLKEIMAKSELPLKRFTSCQEAETWLSNNS